MGALEVIRDLVTQQRTISHFLCPVSGGGLMAGQALAIADGFPDAKILGVEPDGADDFARSLAAGKRLRIDHPQSICDGLLSYDVGEYNWPILKRLLQGSVTVPDLETRRAMKWIYQHHGLKTEPSGAITIAALLTGKVDLNGDGDIAIVLSGRNADESAFRNWIDVESTETLCSITYP